MSNFGLGRAELKAPHKELVSASRCSASPKPPAELAGHLCGVVAALRGNSCSLSVRVSAYKMTAAARAEPCTPTYWLNDENKNASLPLDAVLLPGLWLLPCDSLPGEATQHFCRKKEKWLQSPSCCAVGKANQYTFGRSITVLGKGTRAGKTLLLLLGH